MMMMVKGEKEMEVKKKEGVERAYKEEDLEEEEEMEEEEEEEEEKRRGEEKKNPAGAASVPGPGPHRSLLCCHCTLFQLCQLCDQRVPLPR